MRGPSASVKVSQVYLEKGNFLVFVLFFFSSLFFLFNFLFFSFFVFIMFLLFWFFVCFRFIMFGFLLSFYFLLFVSRLLLFCFCVCFGSVVVFKFNFFFYFKSLLSFPFQIRIVGLIFASIFK
jgi:hypothetical protein